MNLRSGESDSVVLHHGFEHVVDQLLSFGGGQSLPGDPLRLHSGQGMPKAANRTGGHASCVTRLVELFAVWVFVTGTPHMANLGDNRNSNFFRQYGTDIKADRHVNALEAVSRDAFAFQLLCDRPDF